MRELLEQHVPAVYRFALRLARNSHAAEELTQETMLRAWKHRGKLAEADTARPFLLRIAINLWRDELRRNSVRRSAASQGPLDASRPRVEPAEQLARQEAADEALAALDRLPHRQQQVLYLSACEDLSIGDIARVLDITAGAARSSLSLARHEMRRLLTHAADQGCGTAEGGC